jgi:hypothetical protein
VKSVNLSDGGLVEDSPEILAAASVVVKIPVIFIGVILPVLLRFFS